MNDLLSRLPQYEPRPDLWSRIEADLGTDERLAQITNELPDFEPDDRLWSIIDAALSVAEQIPDESRVLAHPAIQSTPVRRLGQPRPSGAGYTWPVWGVAAACLILLGTWLFRYVAALPAERIEYAVEQQPEGLPTEPETIISSPADQRAEAFIEQQCREEALACQRPEVRELRAQLGELSAEQERLLTEQQRFSDDPALIRAQVQLENQRAEVTKELITLLRS